MSGFLCSMVGATFAVAAEAEVIRAKKGITAVGNAQIDTAQSKFGGASALFDGNGDYLLVSRSTSDFAFGTGDFTVEFWARFSTLGVTNILYDLRPSGGTNFLLFLNSSNTIIFNNGSDRISVGQTISTGVWYHYALSRSGTSTKLFRDGTQIGSTYTDSTNYTGGANDLRIGWNSVSGAFAAFMNGHLDEVRISNSARYTSNFTAPTTPFVNDSNTLLLIHADGTDASTFFEDDNGVRAPKGITAVQQAQIDTAQSKFGGSSLLLDGSGTPVDHLLVSTVAAESSGELTFEGWVRFAALPNTGGSGYMMWYVAGSNTYILFQNDRVQVAVNNSYYRFVFGSNFTTNIWYHIAVVRESNNDWFVYRDGVKTTGAVDANDTDVNKGGNWLGDGQLIIGKFTDDRGGFNGHTDELRISNIARYTANFTPSTTAFVNDANTLLLLHCDGTDGSTVFRDDNGALGAAPKTLTASGNAQLSTAQSKFGSSSLLLDGNGDYLTVTNAHDFNFQKNDFTIEAWIRFDALATSNRHTLISNGVSSFTTGWIKFSAADLGGGVYKPTITSYDYSSGGSPILQSSTTVSDNTWYHLAWVRQSTNHYLYLDGVQVASATNGTAQGINVNMNLSGTQIGRYSFDNGTPPSATYMDGYIDEMRISKVARYTAAFTPSTSAFTPDADTVFLSHFEGANASTTIVDSGGRTQKGISAIGNAQIDTAQSKFGGASALFDGNGDYLQLTNSSDYNFTGNYTIEGWWYQPSNVAAGIYPTLIGTGAVSDNKGWAVTSEPTTNKIIFITSPNGSSGMQVLLTSANLSAATWNHWAIVRNNSVLTLYINGTASGSTYTTTGNSIASTYPLYIGGGIGGLSSGNFSSSSATVVNLNGHLDEIRISNTARYTTGFTPATAPFQNDANTLLLLHCDGTDGSTVFFDDNGIAPYTP